MILLKPQDYAVMPWKNGLGSTTEIYRMDGPDGAMDWRVSIAEVATAGPFSNFAGYDRHIMVIAGAGMVLHGGPDGPVDVSPAYRPCTFSGDWPVSARLIDGPVKDFNLIARRSSHSARLEFRRLVGPAEIGVAGGTCLIHALGGSFTVDNLKADAGCSVLAALDRPMVVSPNDAACAIAVCALSRAPAQ